MAWMETNASFFFKCRDLETGGPEHTWKHSMILNRLAN